MLVSYMLEQWSHRARLDPARVGAFGFSSGGFTVLAAAGTMTDAAAISWHCRVLPALFDCQLPKTNPATPSTSPPGFDRAGFHVAFNREVVRFFRQNLRRRAKQTFPSRAP
ncbi:MULTISPECIES: hypothetical protein [Alphaproteobacteria]|uniref:hypothetical protein n=1 Tax=Alphaproteobacteria TaxID=28211 RepID=UPI0012FDADD4|nr:MULTISPECIES: hypothetical protein [Alphaproteobacteria]NOG70798.1 hypothetical protein [Roseicella sp. DB1501]